MVEEQGKCPILLYNSYRDFRIGKVWNKDISVTLHLDTFSADHTISYKNKSFSAYDVFQLVVYLLVWVGGLDS